MSEDPSDDALRARLRGADPAASLPPVEADRVDRLLEDAMSQDTLTGTDGTRTRPRRALTWVAAAAAVVVVGVGAVALLDGDEQDPPPAAGPAATVTALRVPAAAPGRCMVPNAATLANAAYAVDGEVTEVADGLATLEVTRWYTGEPTDEVRVEQGEASRTALVGAPVLEEGERYLLAGTSDGSLMVCGFSAAHSDDLAALYAEAFDS